MTSFLQAQVIKAHQLNPLINISQEEQIEELKLLLSICNKSLGLSGRALRKIPFIAHALFLNNSFASLKEFLEAMEKAVEVEKNERKYFEEINDV